MRWGKKSGTAEVASDLWTLEAGFNSAWRVDHTSDGEYVLKGRSAESLGWLDMTLRINRHNANAVCTAEWNSGKGEPGKESKPKPVKLNATLVLKKGRQTKRLNF